MGTRSDDHRETLYRGCTRVRLLHTTCQRGHGSSITVEMEARSILPWGRSAPRGAFDDRKNLSGGEKSEDATRRTEGVVLMHDRGSLLLA